MCQLMMTVNYKIAIVHHLLDTAAAVDDLEVARHFVQRALNAMIGPAHPDFKQIGRIVRNPVEGMKGKAVLPDLERVKFMPASRFSQSAFRAAKRALAAENLAAIRRHAREARKYLDAALRSSVPAAIKAVEL
jgi:hypothetical protein